jgi:hypothetical protein
VLGTLGRAKGVEVLCQVRTQMVRWEVYHNVFSTNRVLRLDESKKGRGPSGVGHEGEVLAPGREAGRKRRGEEGTAL